MVSLTRAAFLMLCVAGVGCSSTSGGSASDGSADSSGSGEAGEGVTSAASEEGADSPGTDSSTSGLGESGDGDGDESDSSGDDGAMPDVWEDPTICPPDAQAMNPGQAPFPFETCSLPEPCPVVSQGSWIGSDGNVAAMDCILNALENGEVGLYRIGFDDGFTSATLGIRRYLGDRGEVSDAGWQDFSAWGYRRAFQAVPDYSFTSCAGIYDWDLLVECVLAGLGDCEVWAAESELCPE